MNEPSKIKAEIKTQNRAFTKVVTRRREKNDVIISNLNENIFMDT